MAWITDCFRNRKKDRAQHPTIESLDDRCLLSTTPGTEVLSAAKAGVPAFSNHLRPETSVQTPPVERARAHVPASVATREMPVGSVAAGTAAVYDPIINAAATRSAYSVDGKGMAVAVIDTGVDYKNSAFGGSFGANAKVIAGYNFANNSADPMATTSQHGTAVAGLIASSDASDPGVAPGVNIVALKVVGDNNSADLGSIVNALQWVVDHHSEYNITVVNMSLSDGGNYAHNWFAQDGGNGQKITELIGQLTSMKIAVVAATGNSFTGQQGEGFTSIVDGVIGVTATDTSDHLLSNAQRLGSTVGMGSMTDLAAPGKGLVAPAGDSGTTTVEGTSFAAPLVSGAVVLLQQIYASRFGTLPTVDQVTGWLEKGARAVNDSVTGLTIGRLDVLNSASLVPQATATAPASPPPPPPPPVVVTTPTQTDTGGSAATNPTASVPVVDTTTTSPPPTTTTTPTTTTSGDGTTTTTTTTTSPGSATTTVTASSNVRIYVNGKRVTSSDQSSTLSAGSLDTLIQGMNAWASDDSSDSTDAGTSQVRVWKAATRASSLAAAGKLYPTGRLAVRMSHPRRRAR
ncbi:S8 family peptidase [Aquisphaera insulae]|uniref:S8 family peptidase n=1 Tax=Aquisphaera insulae TaxID=2712864 RepID=UPI0013EB2ECA|nr:S8 family serine peptidase [Aquisphaera insulae]